MIKLIFGALCDNAVRRQLDLGLVNTRLMMTNRDRELITPTFGILHMHDPVTFDTERPHGFATSIWNSFLAWIEQTS